jgi:DNA mismatch repair protein MutS
MVPGRPPAPPDPGQLALFADAPQRHPLMDELRDIDLNAMTPLEALNRLAELQRKAAD